MAAKKSAAKAAGAVGAARANPYVRRAIEDEELRDNVRTAFESAKSAYSRLNHGKSATKAIMDDRKLHRDLRDAADALRDAGQALREGPKRRRKGGAGRKLLFLLVAGGIAMAVSGELRSKVLDALFGKEEEFDYTSTTTPAAAPPAAAPAGAAS